MKTIDNAEKQKNGEDSKNSPRRDYEKPVLGKIDLTAQEILGFCCMADAGCSGSTAATS